MNLLVCTQVVLLARGAVWILFLAECSNASDGVLGILLLHRNVPVVRRGLCAQNPHSAFHSSPGIHKRLMNSSVNVYCPINITFWRFSGCTSTNTSFPDHDCVTTHNWLINIPGVSEWQLFNRVACSPLLISNLCCNVTEKP